MCNPTFLKYRVKHEFCISWHRAISLEAFGRASNSQTGKTTFLITGFPSAVRASRLFGVGCRSPARFYVLNTASYSRKAGVKGFLSDLLDGMARVTGVPVDALLSRTRVVGDSSFGAEAEAIRRLYDMLPSDAPNFFLLDEVRQQTHKSASRNRQREERQC